jgi:chorismate mutase-like protein
MDASQATAPIPRVTTRPTVSVSAMVAPEPVDPTAALAPLRAEIDEIDRQIVALLGRRMAACRQVAGIKAGMAASVLQPGRVRDVLLSRRTWALADGVDPDFAEQLFRDVLAETHRIEVADHADSAPPEKAAGPTDRSDLDTVAVRLDHVTVTVADLDAATDLFRSMGFTVGTTDDPHVRLASAGGVTILLVSAEADPAVAAELAARGPGVAQIAVEVLNASFTHAALAAAGVGGLTDVIVDADGHEQLFTVADAATGVRLGFISRTAHRVPMSGANVAAMYRALT